MPARSWYELRLQSRGKDNEQLIQTVQRLDQFHGGHLLLHNDRCILQRMDLNLTAVLKTTDFECGTGEKEAAIRQLLVKFHLLLSSFYIV